MTRTTSSPFDPELIYTDKGEQFGIYHPTFYDFKYAFFLTRHITVNRIIDLMTSEPIAKVGAFTVPWRLSGKCPVNNTKGREEIYLPTIMMGPPERSKLLAFYYPEFDYLAEEMVEIHNRNLLMDVYPPPEYSFNFKGIDPSNPSDFIDMIESNDDYTLATYHPRPKKI